MKNHSEDGKSDKTIIGSIMLHFRPIAPKPATLGLGPDHPPLEMINRRVTRGRPKRKYAKKNNIKSKKNENELDEKARMMTLQLLPEVPSQTVGFEEGSARQELNTSWIDFSGIRERSSTVGFFSEGQSYQTVMDSLVTVESVIGVCTIGGVELGRTDDERIQNLELDTCPGFVSDTENKVRWINPAYRKITCTKDQSSVSLVVKREIRLPFVYPAFSCVLRLQCATCQKEKCSTWQVLPCDVWRMDFGGLAWRLDVSAALSLGR